ncbi:MAG: hypothetical protein AAB928_01900 [Patescibacteria group bacterium]
MATKTASKNKDFVTIPRELYEEFLIWEKTKNVKVVKPTKKDLRIIARGERNFKAGNYVSWEQLKNELVRSSRRSSSKSN